MKKDDKYEKIFESTPPISEGIEMDELELLSIYAHMSDKDKLLALVQFQKMLEEDKMNGLIDADLNENAPLTIEDYSQFMSRTIGHIMREACDWAVFVYKRRFVDGLTEEELLEDIGMENASIMVMSQYYDILLQEDSIKS